MTGKNRHHQYSIPGDHHDGYTQPEVIAILNDGLVEAGVDIERQPHEYIADIGEYLHEVRLSEQEAA